LWCGDLSRMGRSSAVDGPESYGSSPRSAWPGNPSKGVAAGIGCAPGGLSVPNLSATRGSVTRGSLRGRPESRFRAVSGSPVGGGGCGVAVGTGGRGRVADGAGDAAVRTSSASESCGICRVGSSLWVCVTRCPGPPPVPLPESPAEPGDPAEPDAVAPPLPEAGGDEGGEEGIGGKLGRGGAAGRGGTVGRGGTFECSRTESGVGFWESVRSAPVLICTPPARSATPLRSPSGHDGSFRTARRSPSSRNVRRSLYGANWWFRQPGRRSSGVSEPAVL
jgi:hypothetical protein